MAKPLVAGLPPGLELTGGFTIRINALDPITGDEVPDVLISNVVITAADVSGQGRSTKLDHGPIEWLHLDEDTFAAEGAA